MKHEPSPIKTPRGWRCSNCAQPVGEYGRRTRLGITKYWRHITRGPQIAYGNKVKEP